MASSSRAISRLAGPARQLGLRTNAPAATFVTTSCPRQLTSRSLVARSRTTAIAIPRQFTRSYADAPPATPKTPIKKPRRIRTTFKWLWRATYLSLLTGVGLVIYDGYTDRNPEEQFAPDPSKKTLVVLGESLWSIGALLSIALTNAISKVPAGAQSPYSRSWTLPITMSL